MTASADGTVKLWNAESGKQIHSLIGDNKMGVNSAVFSPDGGMIVSASWNNSFTIWDTETGKEILTYRVHDTYVNSAVFSPDGKRIVTASNDYSLKMWYTASGIIDWLSGKKNIYRLTNEDMRNLGIDFIELE